MQSSETLAHYSRIFRRDRAVGALVGLAVGAAVGALHGEAALPRRWRENLLGRTAEADDGRLYALLSRVEELP